MFLLSDGHISTQPSEIVGKKVTEHKTEEVRTWVSTARAHVGGKPKTTCAVSVKIVPPHPSKRMQSKGNRTRSMNEILWAVFVV